MISNVINVQSKQRINSQEFYEGLVVNYVEKDKESLNSFISNGNVEIVRLVNEKGMNLKINKKIQKRLLRLAIRNDRYEMLRILLEKDSIDLEAFGNQVLMLAAKRSRLDIVEILLEKGVDIAGRDEDGFTVLHLAVFYEHIEMVKYLIGKISNINIRGESDRTPLNIAAENGYVEIAEILIDEGADINFSVIESAIRFGQVKIVRFLLDKGVDINIKNQNGFSPLHCAVENENLEMVRILAAKAKEDQEEEIIYDKSVLYSAVESGKIEIVDFFITLETDINRRNNHIKTLLEDAIRIGKLSIVKFLIEIKGTDMDTKCSDNNGRENSLLQLAAESGHLEIVNYLIGLGVNIFPDGKAMLISALKSENTEVIKFFLEKEIERIGDNVNELLQIAVNNGIYYAMDYLVGFNYSVSRGFEIIEREFNELDFVRLIVDKAPTYINCIDKIGYSLLKLAIQNNDENILRFLVDKGADINAKGFNGNSSLHLALLNDKLEIVRFLVDKGADINSEDKYGNSLIHISVKYGKLEIVRFLIDNKYVDVNSKNSKGDSLLHIAVLHDEFEIVQFLVDKVADINAQDSEGYTALHLAAQYGRLETFRFLVDKSADLKAKS